MRAFIFALLTSTLPRCGEEPRPSDHRGHEQPEKSAEEDHGAHGEKPPLPEGYAEVTIEPGRQQLIGLKVARVERTSAQGAIRASATVQADETRIVHVHSKIPGWIEELFVDAIGDRVKKGQPLYSLYSQDLFATQQEYLQSRRSGNPEVVAAVRKRLALWDIPAEELGRLERTGEPQRAVVLRAPQSGTVLDKGAFKGLYVEPGTLLYVIADLSRLWVLVDVYEHEVGRLDRRAMAQVAVEGMARPFPARIDYLYPTVDPTTRTVRVRLVVDNRRGALRPGNFATVELPTANVETVTVPEEAVIDTGVRQLVYQSLGQGRFRPVAVLTGRRAGGRVEIRGGLEPGTEVITGAQFLVDSESQIRGTATGAPGHGGH